MSTTPNEKNISWLRLELSLTFPNQILDLNQARLAVGVPPNSDINIVSRFSGCKG